MDRRLAQPHTVKRLLAFGHGQHACPGRFFASNLRSVLVLASFVGIDIASSRTRAIRKML